MKIYCNNLGPELKPSLKKMHSGYWSIEVPENLCHYIIFKINDEKNQAKFFNCGGHKNVDKKMVEKFVSNLIENDVDASWGKINEFQKLKKQLTENKDKQIKQLEKMKKYYLQQFFN